MRVLFLISLLPALALANICTGAAHVGRYWYNACDQKCVCTEIVPREFTWECYKERREFTCMATEERERFINTFKAISTPGHPMYPQYAALIARHDSGFGTIHLTQNFLPWHRWFSAELEELLQNVDCRVTLPWWDWSKKSASPFTGSPFLSSQSWLGTNGAGGGGGCVQDGPFDTNVWNPPTNGCLKRNFGGTMPTALQITNTLNLPASDFSGFSDALEVQIHNVPHMRIGGTMTTGYSPNAPEFFLHHNFIDKLWNDWQKKSSAHLNAYASDFNPNATMSYAFGATPADHNDLEKNRIRYVRYRSPNFGSFRIWPRCAILRIPIGVFSIPSIMDVLGKAEPQILREIPQLPFTAPTFEEEKMMLSLIEDPFEARDMAAKIKRERDRVERLNSVINIISNDFYDEHSQILGYDSTFLVEALGVKPLAPGEYEEGECGGTTPVSPCLQGEEWDATVRRCRPVSCDSPLACPSNYICKEETFCTKAPCFRCERPESEPTTTTTATTTATTTTTVPQLSLARAFAANARLSSATAIKTKDKSN